MSRILTGLAVAALLLASACDAPRATDVAPTDLPATAPLGEAIYDGANGWNPYAFVLSPVGNDPDPSEVGQFDGDVEPTVELCRPLTGSPRCAPGSILTVAGSAEPARWTVDAGPGGDVITVDDSEELYQTQLRLGLFGLDEGEVYRVQVRVDTRVLVSADLIVTGGNGNGKGKGKGKSGGSSVSVPANTFPVSSTNRTVPFKFRLDDGALCWDALDPEVVSCTSATVNQGTPKVLALNTSGGETVVLDLPNGWVGTVQGEGQVDDITLTIEEVETTQAGGETTCFVSYSLGDPDFGNPERCFDVRADTDTTEDVDVDFTTAVPPVLAFCPDPDVLAAIQGGNDNFLMTSVQQDANGEVARVYPNVAAPSSFPGCASQVASAGPVGRFFASAWDRVVRPAVGTVLPQPLSASRARADLGFGGQILRLSTIFFWSRLPETISLAPATATVEFPGAGLQLDVNENFHHGPAPTPGNVVNVAWQSLTPSVATVSGAGLVTPVGPGTAQIVATATNVKGFDNQFMSDTASITVVAAASVPAQSTATVTPTVDAGDPVQIQIQAKTGQGLNQPLGGDALVINVTGANTTTLSVGNGIVDNQNGTYTASYTPTAAGQDQVAVTMQVPPNGPFQPVQGSPFGVTVTQPFATTNFSSLLGGTGGNQNFVDCPAGQVVIGIDGTHSEWRQRSTFWNFGVLCSEVDASGAPTGVVTKAGTFGWGGPSNDPLDPRTGDTPFSLTCSQGLVADLTAYNNDFVGRLEAGCWTADQITDEEVGVTQAVASVQIQHPNGAIGTPEIGACSPGHVATGLDVFDGYIIDAIAFRCSPIGDYYTPAPPVTAFVTSIDPGTTAAAGFGQTLVLRGSGFPQNPGISIVQNGQSIDGFVFGSDANNMRVRLGLQGGPWASPGSATLFITDAGQPVSAGIPITVSTTPATPVLIEILASNFTNAGTLTTGQTIYVGAWGTDTSGAQVLFTQNGQTQVASVPSTTGGSNFALASQVTVPSLADGPVSVTIRTSVNGFLSGESNAFVLNVDNSGVVALNFSGLLGTPTGGAAAVADCPAGQAAVGLRGNTLNWNGWAMMSDLEMGCRALDTNGAAVGPTTWVGGFGAGTGNVSSVQPFSLSCSSGLLAKLAVGLAPNDRVSSLQGDCYDASQIVNGLVAQQSGVAGFGILSPVGVGVSTTVSGVCDPGHVATGLGARQGQILDAIAFRCTPILDVLPPGGAE